MMEHEKMHLKFEKKNKKMPVKAYGSEGTPAFLASLPMGSSPVCFAR